MKRSNKNYEKNIDIFKKVFKKGDTYKKINKQNIT